MYRLSCPLLTLCLLLSSTARGQDRDFFVNGSAIQLNDSCFQLTTAEGLFQVGSIWYPDKVDLRNSFDLVMEMDFGCSDLEGADGIVFGLQPVSASVGEAGEGLGIGGIRPALGVEFDTHQNDNRLDPPADHVAIMANGAVTHAGPDNLAGPVRARENSDNIETCTTFPLRVNWDAGQQTLRVYFDCSLRLEYTGDIVTDIFGGDPYVYYGFAAATGGLTNRQQVCFTFNSFQRQLEDVTVCPGGAALLDVRGGERYEWSPARGLSSTTLASVKASPDTTTIYTVKIFDGCGLPLLDTVRVAVAGDSAFVKLGQDTTLCPGEQLNFDVTVPTAVYNWSDGSLAGPQVSVSEPGVYSVTATRTDIICTAADRITVGRYDLPTFDLGPPDTALCFGDTLHINAAFPVGQAYLESGMPFDSLDIARAGSYRFVFEHPCEERYEEIDVAYSSCEQYYLPNAFSPDGDGTNDAFFPQDNGDLLRIRRFAVYDRWGTLVFRADDMVTNESGLGWDGSFRGRLAPPGTYVWVMEVDFRSGNSRTEKGDVQLLR